MYEQPACRSCGSKSIEDFGACAPFPDEISATAGHALPAGRLLRCDHCGLGQRHPCPSGEELAAIYRESPADTLEYRPEDNVAWQAVGSRVRRMFDESAPISVLDIGCHTGSFLGGLPKAWKRYGIEGGTIPAGVAKSRHGVTIIGQALESTSSEWNDRFDVVALFDVLEHLPDPADALMRACRLLKPGGTLFASTGDMDSWTWRWSHARHWYLQAPLHISVCSRRFFAYVARRQGLLLRKVTRIAHTRGTLRERAQEAVSALHWGMRERGNLWRVPRRLLESLPGMAHLRHAQAIPWNMKLRDHIVCEAQRRASASDLLPRNHPSGAALPNNFQLTGSD